MTHLTGVAAPTRREPSDVPRSGQRPRHRPGDSDPRHVGHQRVDLHRSRRDHRVPPTAAAERGWRSGVAVRSLTDHDTALGVPSHLDGGVA